MRGLLTASAAMIALVVAAPVAAQRGNGGGTPMGGPSMNLPGGGGPVPGGGPSSTAIDARTNSQGPANASPMGIHNANPNSVLNSHSTTRPTDPADMHHPTDPADLHHPMDPADLHHPSGDEHHSATAHHPTSHDALDLHTGATVFTSAGHSLGTITHVLTDSHGMITGVLVTSPTGQTYTLAPNSLSLSGGMLITSSGG